MTEENRIVNATTGGAKGAKLARFDLIPPDPLRRVAEHYGVGAAKYDARNWEKGYDWSLSFAAMQRHAWAFWNGEDDDPDTGSPHLAAVVFHALAMLEWGKTHPEMDDRPEHRRCESGQNPLDIAVADRIAAFGREVERSIFQYERCPRRMAANSAMWSGDHRVAHDEVFRTNGESVCEVEPTCTPLFSPLATANPAVEVEEPWLAEGDRRRTTINVTPRASDVQPMPDPYAARTCPDVAGRDIGRPETRH